MGGGLPGRAGCEWTERGGGWGAWGLRIHTVGSSCFSCRCPNPSNLHRLLPSPPPGTGKTDTAVQIMHILYHNCPSQRTLVVTHSNQALNDLFTKVGARRGAGGQGGAGQCSGGAGVQAEPGYFWWLDDADFAAWCSMLTHTICMPLPQIVERDVPARYLLRLGMGEAELETELDFRCARVL